MRQQIERSAKATNGTYKNLNQKAAWQKLTIPMPPLWLQQEFAFSLQSPSVDKSKFAIQKALDELNATTKKILNQELGL